MFIFVSMNMKLTNEEVIITNDNKEIYKNLEECYRLTIKSDVKIDLQYLTNVVDLFIYDNCVVRADKLNIKEYLRIGKYSSLRASTLNKVDKIRLFQYSYLQANLMNINQIIFYKNAVLEIPSLKDKEYTSVEYRLFVINDYYEKDDFEFYRGRKIESVKDDNFSYSNSYETYLVHGMKNNLIIANGISEEIAIDNLNFKIENKNYDIKILEQETVINIEHLKLFV